MEEPLRPDDPPARLYEAACRYRAEAAARGAVLDRLKADLGLWLADRRLKVPARVLLDAIARIEREVAGRAAADEP